MPSPPDVAATIVAAGLGIAVFVLAGISLAWYLTPRDERSTVRWLWTPRTQGIALVLWTLAAALVVGSVGFTRAHSMLGDLAYHRGVAYTMQGGDLQGQGPYPGLITYYGGLFPLIMAVASEITGKAFDAVVSVLSWPATLITPLGFLLVGRRIWRHDWFAIGVVVLIGAFVAPLTSDPGALWVDGVLPSASSFWPLYPRDVAMALLCVGLWALLSSDYRVRVGGLGVAVGLTALFHVQIAILFTWFLLVHGFAEAARRRSMVPVRELMGAGVIAAVVSAWWWAPRVEALVRSGALLLADYPGRASLRMGPESYVALFGAAGLLAILALLVYPWLHRHQPGVRIFVLWLAAFLPLVVLNRIVPDLDVVTERRVWLVASIGIVGLAAGGLVFVGRHIPSWALPALVGVAVVLPSAQGIRATLLRIDRVVATWELGEAGIVRDLESSSWSQSMSALNRLVRNDGRAEVLTTDAAAVWTWSFSGAQVFSLWLPGYIKLGFDPAALTGAGYLNRVERFTYAWDHGRAGTCPLARTEDMSVVLVETYNGSIVDFDRSLGSPFRVEPSQRTPATIDRQVAPGIWYVDRNAFDGLEMQTGATELVNWEAPEVRSLMLLVAQSDTSAEPLVRIQSRDAVDDFEGSGTEGLRWLRADLPEGVQGGVKITALRDLTVLRLIGLSPAEGLGVLPETGYAVVPVDQYCQGF
jgi:hypothetical protein